nr:MAG TPA: hypothetical protein [Caudoviricetes sp.]
MFIAVWRVGEWLIRWESDDQPLLIETARG